MLRNNAAGHSGTDATAFFGLSPKVGQICRGHVRRPSRVSPCQPGSVVKACGETRRKQGATSGSLIRRHSLALPQNASCRTQRTIYHCHASIHDLPAFYG
jgi:hypothetical protein